MMLRGFRVLVTGATGFLGGRAVERLRERGAVPIAHGRSVPKLASLAARGFETVGGDLGEDGVARRVLAEADANLVLHAAALSAPYGPKKSFKRCNVFATEQLALAAAAHERVQGLVHVSTPSLYCAGSALVDVAEDAPLPRRAINHYAATKRQAEETVRRICGEGSLPLVVLRPRAIFGPGDTALFPRLLRALKDRRLPVLGDGQNRVDLTYVDNASLGCELALAQVAGRIGDGVGGTYNITNGEPIALWPLIRQIAEHLGYPPPTRRVRRAVARPLAGLLEHSHALFRRRGEPLLTRYSVDALSLDATLDISAARRDLGYEPEVPVAEGVRRFLASLDSRDASASDSQNDAQNDAQRDPRTGRRDPS